MQIEITLNAPAGSDYSARDLGFLLHKHPDHVHERTTAAGKVTIFYPEIGDEKTTALLHLNIDPIALVRGKGRGSDGLLDQYVNDRPYIANSFLSVALTRSYSQTLAGKSKERQELADRALPLEARVTPVAVSGGVKIIAELFEPLGYDVTIRTYDDDCARGIHDVRIAGTVRMSALLNHLYVLVPVLDDAKHWWIGDDEIDRLLAKGEGWLADHPAKKLITRRALKHRRGLVNVALARIAAETEEDQAEEIEPSKPEAELEAPIRLHDMRLDAVMELLRAHRVKSVIDLGCGEGKLLQRLIKERFVDRIVGVDPSVRTLEYAARRLRLDQASEALRERISLQMGSLTYADRRWRGFDAATLVEVIEHIDPPRLSALERSLFADASPQTVAVTTPNREYNALFEGMAQGALRHPDHRFEWTREEFQSWANGVAERNGYSVKYWPIGPIDERHGAPSQMAVFALPSADVAI